MIRTTAVLLAAAGIAFAASPAMAAPAAGKDLCKAGGYTHYVDSDTYKPFQSQGECVSFVNHGGTLLSNVRVVGYAFPEEPPAGTYGIGISVIGFPASTPILFQITYANGEVEQRELTTDVEGEYGEGVIGQCDSPQGQPVRVDVQTAPGISPAVSGATEVPPLDACS